jgi:hypothetical protein
MNSGHFLAARCAPRRPEVHDHDLAAPLVETLLLAGGVRQGEPGQRGSGLRGRCRCAGALHAEVDAGSQRSNGGTPTSVHRSLGVIS